MKELYIQPLVEEISFVALGLVCQSPKPGGNEDIGYEDWGTIIEG